MGRRLLLPVLALALAAPAGALEPLEPLPDRRAVRSTAATGTASTSAATRETLAELLMQIEALTAEVRQLRGQVEVQANEIERMKARERDLNADFDRRLRELERRPAAAEPAVAEPAVAGPAPKAATTISAEEQAAYDAAFRLLKQGQYERAAKSFREYIAKYPRGGLTDNAQYWLGEANYVVRNYKAALEEFNKVLTDYPGSRKAPDALLKIGYTHLELGEATKGRDALMQVSARYPNSDAAKAAQDRLAKLKKDKR